ncbi:MAG TPA: Flp pilus assembly protein CpaB [Stellaceae bacterium]|jgi:pilus assembly protein CpaB|nr:Flp pilus assembly protein CpaB [Stellaceae bacterium]
MRARTVILLIIALILAGGTTMTARVWLASQRAQKAEATPIAVPTPTKSVLIARNSISRGQILRAEDMQWEQWPEGGIGRNYILLGTRTPESYAGWVVRNPIAAGEPLSEQKIIAPGNRGFLAAVLRPGMRAVSVAVNITSGISGFIFPGDHVDLIVNYSVQDRPTPGQTTSGPLAEHKISETILRDVRVIAIDQKLDSKPGDVIVAKTTTFEVTPKQSEIIALANEMGKLSLSLRSLVSAPNELQQEPEADTLKHDVSDATTTPTTTAETPRDPPSETFTLDSDVSPFLRSPGAKQGSINSGDVTILRGGQSTASSSTQQQ